MSKKEKQKTMAWWLKRCVFFAWLKKEEKSSKGVEVFFSPRGFCHSQRPNDAGSRRF